eukprot:TRINITY_DN16303_c0_g2_i1.p1 TRINITY_DN16303_c0_g2~~TRINITY_DN16303_c0_g2_i1.p1  ORF type:complete len:674 (-),score=156.66 TRINITY_DN16303_c0_g2_i1:283-2304(-)
MFPSSRQSGARNVEGSLHNQKHDARELLSGHCDEGYSQSFLIPVPAIPQPANPVLQQPLASTTTAPSAAPSAEPASTSAAAPATASAPEPAQDDRWAGLHSVLDDLGSMVANFSATRSSEPSKIVGLQDWEARMAARVGCVTQDPAVCSRPPTPNSLSPATRQVAALLRASTFAESPAFSNASTQTDDCGIGEGAPVHVGEPIEMGAAASSDQWEPRHHLQQEQHQHHRQQHQQHSSNVNTTTSHSSSQTHQLSPAEPTPLILDDGAESEPSAFEVEHCAPKIGVADKFGDPSGMFQKSGKNSSFNVEEQEQHQQQQQQQYKHISSNTKSSSSNINNLQSLNINYISSTSQKAHHSFVATEALSEQQQQQEKLERKEKSQQQHRGKVEQCNEHQQMHQEDQEKHGHLRSRKYGNATAEEIPKSQNVDKRESLSAALDGSESMVVDFASPNSNRSSERTGRQDRQVDFASPNSNRSSERTGRQDRQVGIASFSDSDGPRGQAVVSTFASRADSVPAAPAGESTEMAVRDFIDSASESSDSDQEEPSDPKVKDESQSQSVSGAKHLKAVEDKGGLQKTSQLHEGSTPASKANPQGSLFSSGTPSPSPIPVQQDSMVAEFLPIADSDESSSSEEDGGSSGNSSAASPSKDAKRNLSFRSVSDEGDDSDDVSELLAG